MIARPFPIIVFLLFAFCSPKADELPSQLMTGAERLDEYLPLLEGKRVGVVINHTSMVGDKHLVDTLLSRGVKVGRIFGPEHGFRGDEDDGKHIESTTDPKTGISVKSLYGKTRKPAPEDLADLDVVIFDIQDVGARFYTFISTMHYVMEACAENNVEVIVLDRPNPNGYYVDGPVRKPEFKTFVGMHPIPAVHGLTVAELAQMINGEKWLDGGISADLHVVPCLNYSHSDIISIESAPSPNLPNSRSVFLYPSLCLFEGTKMSIGRGTDFPFQVIGYPDSTMGNFHFKPRSIPGKSTYPKHEDVDCFGIDLRELQEPAFGRMDLSYLIDYYKRFEPKAEFFTSGFDRLAGNSVLKEQIRDGLSYEEIRDSWQTDLDAYKLMRKKYLLYPDFE